MPVQCPLPKIKTYNMKSNKDNALKSTPQRQLFCSLSETSHYPDAPYD